MLLKLLLLYCGFLQIEVPLASRWESSSIKELAVLLEMTRDDEQVVSYRSFLTNFYESVSLPSISEAFLYNKPEVWDCTGASIWWDIHAKDCRRWMDFLRQQKLNNLRFGNLENADRIEMAIRNIELLHSVYDKIDDAARTSYHPLIRRRAIRFVKEQVGDMAWWNMDIPRPEEFIWAHWKRK